MNLKNQQIIDDNKLIAEFDDTMKKAKKEDMFFADNTFVKDGGYYTNQQFKYHRDWNWLMAVFKKITELHFNSKKIDSMADYGRHLYLVQDKLCEANIESTHTEIAKWIRWYNKEIENDTK
ncbi:MAG: hypothetical protein V3W20_11415 [Candidatus Neomarinimicrobiota bacterium]